MDSYEHFFAWCARQGLNTDRVIADAFGMTPQTVRNWRGRLRKGSGTPPAYLSLACAGFESYRAINGDSPAQAPSMTVGDFKAWRDQHGLKTLERTGGAFGLTRQAVHNWFKRESLPHWLTLACLGYQAERKPDDAAQ